MCCKESASSREPSPISRTRKTRRRNVKDWLAYASSVHFGEKMFFSAVAQPLASFHGGPPQRKRKQRLTAVDAEGIRQKGKDHGEEVL
jgi:hypothetical protein